MEFHIFQDAARQWRWYLLAENRRKIATSAEAYYHRIDCIDAINKVISTTAQTSVYED
jgi:uncharacterized protein YegP (UPF0339 family)